MIKISKQIGLRSSGIAPTLEWLSYRKPCMFNILWKLQIYDLSKDSTFELKIIKLDFSQGIYIIIIYGHIILCLKHTEQCWTKYLHWWSPL